MVHDQRVADPEPAAVVAREKERVDTRCRHLDQALEFEAEVVFGDHVRDRDAADDALRDETEAIEVIQRLDRSIEEPQAEAGLK